MKNALTTLAMVGVAALGASLSVVGPSPLGEGEACTYRFQEAPVHALGIQSLTELRGKPVLIDFWGTR